MAEFVGVDGGVFRKVLLQFEARATADSHSKTGVGKDRPRKIGARVRIRVFSAKDIRPDSALDMRVYEKGIKISNAEMSRLDIRGDAFRPEWSDSIAPWKPKSLRLSLPLS